MEPSVRSMTIRASYISPYTDTNREHFTLVVHSVVCNLVAKVPDLDSKMNSFKVGAFPSDVPLSSVNIPWPESGMTDADYIYAFQKIVMPIAMEFAPELVISMSVARLCLI